MLSKIQVEMAHGRFVLVLSYLVLSNSSGGEGRQQVKVSQGGIHILFLLRTPCISVLIERPSFPASSAICSVSTMQQP